MIPQIRALSPSNWFSLAASPSELNLKRTLHGGQAFRWKVFLISCRAYLTFNIALIVNAIFSWKYLWEYGQIC